MVKHRRLLEHAEIFGEHYGTPLEPVRAALQAGRPIILEIDVQGGIQVHRKMPQATFILILPPSDEELRRRLSGRGTESPKAVQARFDKARAEIRAARRSGAYHRVVINDNLREVVRQVVQIIKQECDKP
jgi:guanylate kinase